MSGVEHIEAPFDAATSCPPGEATDGTAAKPSSTGTKILEREKYIVLGRGEENLDEGEDNGAALHLIHNYPRTVGPKQILTSAILQPPEIIVPWQRCRE